MRDYMRVLGDSFGAKLPEERRQELETIRQAGSALLDQQGRKMLLRLVDAHTEVQDELALSSFAAGYRSLGGLR